MTTFHVSFATLPLVVLMWLQTAPQAKKADAPAAPAPPPRVAPLPAGQQQVLQAMVIAVDGKAEWKAASATTFKAAAVNDLLDPGAEIRTGLRSTLSLRVGKNATLVIDRASRVELPMIVQDGAVLRTRAAVYRGKVDFKVESVGITSDFQVVTPSATLAVRGTGFRIEWGALNGLAVTGVDTNHVRAIELNYLASLQTLFITGGGKSTSQWPNPVAAALYDTVYPPPIDVDGDDLLPRGPGGYYGTVPRQSLQDVMKQQTAIRNGGSDVGTDKGPIGPNGKPGG